MSADVAGHDVVDFTDMKPICDEQRFAEILEGIVADYAPRLFAVVLEYGTRYDGEIAAWGMAFLDRADAVGIDGHTRFSLGKPEDMLHLMGGENITPRIVWYNPAAATPREDDDVSTEP